MWVESPWGKVRCLCSYSEAVEPGTVWTWNAIGKAPGAWRLAPDANESQRGFLLNHLISDELPGTSGATSMSNSDPITGQAALVRRPRRHSQAAEADEPQRRHGRNSPRCRRHLGTPATTPRLTRVLRADASSRNDPARPRHRPQRVRRLPRLRDELQGVEHVGVGGAARRPRALRQGSERRVLQSRADLRGRRIPAHADRALPEVVPALRGSAVRARVPDRRLVQARRGRHRARRLRQMHRLQVLRLGVPLRRARDRSRAQGDDEVHALRRPDLR